MFKGKKVIIFDMDGTLIDSVGIWNTVDEVLIARIRTDGQTAPEDYQAQRDAVMRRFSTAEDPYLAYCDFLRTKYRAVQSAQEIHDLRYTVARELLREQVDYKPHAEIFLKKLRERGFTLVIASTTRRGNMAVYRTENRHILEKAPIDEIFSLVYTRENAREIKPHPEIYLRVLSELRVAPEECLVFEDSLIGVEAAKGAGLEAAVIYDRYSDGDREAIDRLAGHAFADYDEAIARLESEVRT